MKAKAIFYVKTDVEGRRRGEQQGLDTPVVHADNDECQMLDFFQRINENVSIPPQQYSGNAETETIRPLLKPVVKYVI